MKYSDSKLRSLYAQGLSYDEIAVQLGTTRDAISGKVTRLKLQRRRIKPNSNTIAIRPRNAVEMTKTEMHDMLRRAVENTK